MCNSIIVIISFFLGKQQTLLIFPSKPFYCSLKACISFTWVLYILSITNMSHIASRILFIVSAEASVEIIWHRTEINTEPCELNQLRKLWLLWCSLHCVHLLTKIYKKTIIIIYNIIYNYDYKYYIYILKTTQNLKLFIQLKNSLKLFIIFLKLIFLFRYFFKYKFLIIIIYNNLSSELLKYFTEVLMNVTYLSFVSYLIIFPHQ